MLLWECFPPWSFGHYKPNAYLLLFSADDGDDDDHIFNSFNSIMNHHRLTSHTRTELIHTGDDSLNTTVLQVSHDSLSRTGRQLVFVSMCGLGPHARHPSSCSRYHRVGDRLGGEPQWSAAVELEMHLKKRTPNRWHFRNALESYLTCSILLCCLIVYCGLGKKLQRSMEWSSFKVYDFCQPCVEARTERIRKHNYLIRPEMGTTW